MQRTFINAHADASGHVSRRGFMGKLAAAGAATGVVGLSWRDLLIAQAAELQKSGKKMILLWMDGGPSQYDTFNPKPGSEKQGPAKTIKTNVSGIDIAEYWPRTAQVMDKIALVRSMKSNERDHFRAIKLVRTGYPITPTIDYPTWGSVVARDRWDPGFDLPAFVRIGTPRIKTRDVGAGVLGARYAAFKVDDPEKLPPDVLPQVQDEVLRRRLSLTEKLDGQFANNGGKKEVEEKREIYERTSRFVLSPLMEAFDLDREPAKVRDSYGRSPFGQGCLLARRLVESGVSFVEVLSTGTRNDQGWDTHKTGFEDNPHLCHETDPGYAQLLIDLDERGMLEDTLVVWMGEFCRTPNFKKDGGRDHYSEGWISAFAGGGVKGGQVIGATDKDGVKVTDRPVGVQDLFVTFCHVLGMDPHDEYVTDFNQPLKLVKDGGGELISELF